MESFGVGFADLAVVGEQAVGFVLHITDLGIDRGAKTGFVSRDHLLQVQLFHSVIPGGFIGEFAVAVGAFGVEHMTLGFIREAAKFRQNQGLVRFFQPDGFEVHMATVHIRLFLSEPAGGAVNKPG